MRALLVEDDPVSLAFLREAVESSGWEVVSAETGREGIALFRQHHPDVVIADIEMPDMDGLEVLKEIRQESAETIVIIETGGEKLDYPIAALRHQANNFITKPFNPDEIQNLLRKYEKVTRDRQAGHHVEQTMLVEKRIHYCLENDLHLVPALVNQLLEELPSQIDSGEQLNLRLGLTEILANAIEHGNLEISGEEKQKILESGEGHWHELLKSRAQDPAFANRRVRVEYQQTRESLNWRVSDEGPGFDWQAIMEPPQPGQLEKMHGRGILLSRLSFDVIRFEEPGNTVLLEKRLPKL